MGSAKFKPPAPDKRQPPLAELRNLKMASSAQAYVRGSTLKFYEWLESSSGRSLPHGPAVWICGDCHTGNLGPVANAEGKIALQIRDLDQTVIGNPAHDLIRLGLSLAVAGRGSNLPGVTMGRMLEHITIGYEQAFTGKRADGEYLEKPESVRLAMKAALKRKWKHLAKERIEDDLPTIPPGKRFWPLSGDEKQEIKRLFKEEEVRKLVTSLRSRDNDAGVEVLDAAYWVKGCSSLGLLRYAVLLGVGGDKGDLCLMDIKEARHALAPAAKKADIPTDNAERIVTGARALSPFLGKRMLAAPFLGRKVFLRELLPQDLKMDMGNLTHEEALRTAWYLSTIVGKGHAHQMDGAMRRSWRAALKRTRFKTVDAPSWLWSNIVELISIHEVAYLEHCRRYAMETDKA